MQDELRPHEQDEPWEPGNEGSDSKSSSRVPTTPDLESETDPRSSPGRRSPVDHRDGASSDDI